VRHHASPCDFRGRCVSDPTRHAAGDARRAMIGRRHISCFAGSAGADGGFLRPMEARKPHAPRTSAARLVRRNPCRPARAPLAEGPNPEVRGKFLVVGDTTFHVRGRHLRRLPARRARPGIPRPGRDRCGFRAGWRPTGSTRYGSRIRCRRGALLDLAAEHGLRVMVGPLGRAVRRLPDRSKGSARRRGDRARQGARLCGVHPALLCYALGNEIPAQIVRWLGPAADRALPSRVSTGS